MKAITLRNIPPEVARKLRQKAHTAGDSLNKKIGRASCRERVYVLV